MNQTNVVSWGSSLAATRSSSPDLLSLSEKRSKEALAPQSSLKPSAPPKAPATTKTASGLSKDEVRKLTELSTKNDEVLKIVEKASGPEGSEAELNHVLTLLQSRSSRAQALSNVIRELFDTMKRIIANFAG